MKKKIVLACLVLFITFMVRPSVVVANIRDDIPNPKGDIYVQDPANYLSPAVKNNVIQQAKITDQQTTAQIGFLLVPSLNGHTMDEYAVEAFRKYGLGSKEKNNGVLVVIAVEDKQARIEVGYGLEGVLPDGKVGRILDEYTIPALKVQNYDAAVLNTYKAIAKEVVSEYSGETTPGQPVPSKSGNPFLWIIGIVGGGVVVFVLWKVLTRNMNREEKAHVLFVFIQFFQVIISMIIRNNNGGKGGGNSSGRGGSSGGGGAGRDW
jgi:uncharacterized protein